MYDTPDANSGLTRYLDSEFGEEAERRAEIRQAAKELEISDIADRYMESNDSIRDLIDWVVNMDGFDKALANLIASVEFNVSKDTIEHDARLLACVFREAAQDKAKWIWEQRHG